jgi:mitochondrial fission protein ELM1
MTSVWGLVDDSAQGQALGVIAKLGQPFTLKRLEYNALSHLPNMLRGASLMGVDRAGSAPITTPWPKLVIAAGRRAVPALRYIKRKSPTTTTIYLMRPDSMRGIDLAVVPAHDQPIPHERLITTLAPLHAITPEALETARKSWAGQFKHLPRPWVALILGGDTRHGRYTAADWRELIQQAQQLAAAGSLLIATSRRTPAEAMSMCEALLQGPHLLHRFHTDKDSPYLGILACADAMIVTGDSLSMCAEASVSGKPVLIYTVPRVLPEKYTRFHARLYEHGIAQPLDANSTIDWAPKAALDDAGKVAYEIRARFPQALS